MAVTEIGEDITFAKRIIRTKVQKIGFYSLSSNKKLQGRTGCPIFQIRQGRNDPLFRTTLPDEEEKLSNQPTKRRLLQH